MEHKEENRKHQEPLIRIRGLKKVYRPKDQDGEDSFEVQALAGVDLDIHRGDFVAIMGPSGSGKSTLMQILGLLDRSTGGSYFLDGQDVSLLNDDEWAELRCKNIGFIFQFFNLLPRTTTVDNVSLPMLYAGNPAPQNRAKELLTLVGLEKRFGHRPHQLSGGQQQRVAIARALANQPQLIFADEPTGNISTEQAGEVLGKLDELNQKGTTIILVTHEPEVAAKAKRLIRVRDGKVESDMRMRGEDPSATILPVSRPRQDEQRKNSAFWQKVGENFRMAWTALMLNKLRTTLATLGVVIGIASVVTMVAVGTGAQKAIEDQLTALGTNILSIRAISQRTSKGAETPFKKFTVEEYEALRKHSRLSGDVTDVDAQVYGSVQASYGNHNSMTDLTGAFPSMEVTENNHPVVGRFFSKEENETHARVALIGQTVVRNLFGEDANPIGSTIKVNRLDFTVIGVLPAKGATSFKDRDDVIIVPAFTAMHRVLGRRTLMTLVVQLVDTGRADAVTEDLTRFLRNLRKTPDHMGNDFEIRNLNEIQQVYTRTTGIISSMLASIAAVSLLVGGIGIMNVMLVAVKERTREVGLRKALGARNRDILLQFLIEAVLIGIFGGVLGIIFGYALSGCISTFFDWPTLVPVHTVFLAFFFAITVGIVFGLWPAKQASELSPIEALRYE